MTTPDPLRARALHQPDRPALEGGGGPTLTYGELDREARRVAGALRELGAEPGARVALLLSLRWETVVAIHGVARAGCTLAPLSPGWTAVELADAVEALRPGVMICEVETEGAALEALGRAGLGSVATVSLDSGGSVASLDELDPGEGDLPGIDPDAAAAVLWTSGTTGGRRGVELGWRGVMRHIEAVTARLGLDPDDRWHAGLQPAHVGGLMLILRAAAVGSRLVVDGPFDAERLAALLDGGRVTHGSLVPTMLRRLLDARPGRPAPETLRCLLLGGAHTPLNLLDDALEAGYPVALTYGMTEASSQVATAPPELVRRKPGTVGRALDGVELRIAGAGGTAEEGVENSGEILVRGETLARGCLAGPDLSDPEGWYHTGDLGRLDGEGHLWITGRLSTRIVTGGVTVDPGEVEEVLRSHPGVADAVVVGLPDEEWGERVAAAVVLAGVEGEESPDRLERRLDPFLRERLSPAKRPRELRQVEGVPRNANGKPDRRAVARLFQGSGSGSGRPSR